MATDDNQKQYVVGIGEALLDCFSENNRKVGGAPLIFAYHAAQSGLNGMIISAIGEDKEGEEIKSWITNHNLDYSLELIHGKPTGTVIVNKDDPNNPLYTIYPENSAWSYMSYSDKLNNIAKNTRAVYFGPLASFKGTSKTAIEQFLSAVDDECLKIFDVNLRFNPNDNKEHKIPLYDDKVVIDYIDKCNVLKVNYDELKVVCELLHIDGNERRQCRKIMEKYVKIKYLIVTIGEEGSTIFWRDKDHNNRIAFSSLGMPVELKNTVGAGDALAGAFIGEILKGKTEVRAHHYAVQRSVIVCEAEESMPHIAQNDIFISYSRKDERIVVDVFCKLFENWGFTIWRDKERITKGERFDDKIRHAIQNCDVVIYFSSKDANCSQYVTQELKFANENLKTIIPIKLDNSDFNNEINPILKYIDNLDLNHLISSINKQIYGHEREKDREYVIGIGELLWDCLHDKRRIGGAPANFAYHVAQFGHQTVVVSAIGNDKDGDDLIIELQNHNLDYNIKKVDLPTGVVKIDNSDKNDPHYDIRTDVAWSAIPYDTTLQAIAKKCSAVCFGTLAQYGDISRKTIMKVLDSVPLNCLKIYDMNLRNNAGTPLYNNEIIISSISKCNILKVNLDEFEYLTKILSHNASENIEKRSKEFLDKYPNIKYLIVTMGTDGSWVFRGDESSFKKTPKVKVKDVVGAGDSFTGAFIGSILNGKTIDDAHRIAVKVSAYVCTQPNGMPEIPEKLKEL